MTSSPNAPYAVCGLLMNSALPLRAPRISGAEPDVTVSIGEPFEMPWERPTEEVLAELMDHNGWPRYSFCREDGGATRARFYSLADFAISADRRSVVCHTHPEVDQELTALLVTGSLVAFLLTCAGELVLHASAVEAEPGSAVVFVGPTGRGKSTTAALLCARGLPLITDDVLPVQLARERPVCHPAANELRLRAKQVGLVDRFVTPPETRMTADERLAVRPVAERSDEAVVEAIVLPLPVRDRDHVQIRRLTPLEAVPLVAATTRIEGWQDARLLSQVFDQAVDLVSRVPVVEAAIPWGPPFGDAMIEELIERLAEVRAGGRG